MVFIGIDEITEEEDYTMADEYRMALEGLLRKAEMDGDADFLREGVRVMGQALMELEVAQHIGAERHERTPERTGQRNGYRDRPWDTRVGTIELKVPRVRDGSFYPVMLDPRKRAERALVAVVQEAYVQGVSTRRVDESGPGPWDERDQQEPGIAPVPGAGHRGGALQDQAPGGRLPLCVAGCHLPEGEGELTGRLPGGGDRHRGQGDAGRGRSWASTWDPARTGPSGPSS